MKSGDHLICDISSQDLWLYLKIEPEKIGIVIFVEVKVYKTATILSLKQSLIDIANQLFSAILHNIIYSDDECELQKITISGRENVLSTEAKSMMDQSMTTGKAEILGNKLVIGNIFGYLDRYALLRLEKKQEEGREKSITIPSCTVSDSLLQISSTMPIRNLRVEPQSIARNSRNAQNISDMNDDYNGQKNCHCRLL